MPRLRFALLAAAVAVTAHDATYLVGHGPADAGAALSAAGHDGYWLAVAGGVISVLVAVMTATAWRWRALRRQLRTSAGRTPASSGPSPRSVVVLALRLAATALAIFVVQENLEAAGTTGLTPGIAVLWAEGSAAAIPVFAAVALLFAVLARVAMARIRGMEAALRLPLPRPRASVSIRPMTDPAGRPRRVAALPDLGRAPPVPVPVAT